MQDSRKLMARQVIDRLKLDYKMSGSCYKQLIRRIEYLINLGEID
jgi:hypothetical protein